MEFQYCDSCGDITQTNHAKGNELLCASCAGKGGPPAEAAPPPSGLQLLEDPTQELSDGTPIGGGDLDFFSNDTLAMRRPPAKPKSSSKLKLVDESPSSNPAPPVAPPAPNPAGETLGMTQPMGGTIYPKKEDERWRVDCLHCAGSLSVRPAVKRSKLRCPRCKGVMVLEPSGEVTSVGSTVVQRRAPEPKAPPQPAPFQAPSKPPVAAAPPAPVPMPTPVAPPIAPPPPGLAAMGPSSPGESDLGRFEQSFLGNTGGSTAVATPPTQVAAPPVAAPPLAPVPMAPAPTAPVAGGGQEFAISPDNTTGFGERNAPVSTDQGAYAGSGVNSVTKHATATEGGVATVGSFQAFTWMTVALLPSIVGILVVHQASGAVGQAILESMGTQVSENGGKLLDWCAKLLGR